MELLNCTLEDGLNFFVSRIGIAKSEPEHQRRAPVNSLRIQNRKCNGNPEDALPRTPRAKPQKKRAKHGNPALGEMRLQRVAAAATQNIAHEGEIKVVQRGDRPEDEEKEVKYHHDQRNIKPARPWRFAK